MVTEGISCWHSTLLNLFSLFNHCQNRRQRVLSCGMILIRINDTILLGSSFFSQSNYESMNRPVIRILCGWGGGGGGGECQRGQSGPNFRNVFFIVWSVYLGKWQYMRNCNGKVHGRNWISHLSNTTAWIIRESTFFSWVGRAGASEGRVISESEHQKGKVIPLCKLFKGRVTHLFQTFNMRMDKLHNTSGRILPNRDWKSKYYRILDLESTQVRHLSKCYFLVVFLVIMCCLCGLGIWICQFIVMHWGVLTIITMNTFHD